MMTLIEIKVIKNNHDNDFTTQVLKLKKKSKSRLSDNRDLKHRQRNQTTTTNSNRVKTVRSVAKTARK